MEGACEAGASGSRDRRGSRDLRLGDKLRGNEDDGMDIGGRATSTPTAGTGEAALNKEVLGPWWQRSSGEAAAGGSGGGGSGGQQETGGGSSRGGGGASEEIDPDGAGRYAA